ncbi:MAG: EAL domain-containing protein, partial [Pseudomonadota bacterium]
WLLNALGRQNFNPSRLEIEITETSLIRNEAFVSKQLKRMRDCGVRIALDDFGTGYSSFNYLHRLPLDRVKIDKSLLATTSKETSLLQLLERLAGLCAALGKGTTIEGVETAEQLELLRDMSDIGRLQGYLFGPALPADAIATIASAHGSPRAMPDETLPMAYAS